MLCLRRDDCRTASDPAGHTEVVDEAVAPTCTTTGLTEGKHCIVCGEVTLAQKEVPYGHNYQTTLTEVPNTVIRYVTYKCPDCADCFVLVLSDVNLDGRINSSDAEAIRPYLETNNCAVYLRGDANMDGSVDSSDAVAILRNLAGYEVRVFNKTIADFNRDGKADSSDAVAILRYLAGYNVW